MNVIGDDFKGPQPIAYYNPQILRLTFLALVGILPISNRSMNPSEKGACCQVKWNIECVDVISIRFSFLYKVCDIDIEMVVLAQNVGHSIWITVRIGCAAT